jgi:ATP-binding cassette subfamily E protein 1
LITPRTGRRFWGISGRLGFLAWAGLFLPSFPASFLSCFLVSSKQELTLKLTSSSLSLRSFHQTRGSELQNYFSRILENNLKALVKPQYVDHIPKAVKGKVGELIRAKDQRERAENILAEMELNHLLERSVDALSGGELQRFTIGIVCVQQADVYMFDEPSSYLDVKQRLRAALTIRSLVASGQGGSEQTYVLVVEHDLAVLDYLSDYICCLYGTPSAYGVVTMPFSVREGINIFLAGFVPTENLRFRDEVSFWSPPIPPSLAHSLTHFPPVSFDCLSLSRSARTAPTHLPPSLPSPLPQALVFKISQNTEEIGSSSGRVQQYRYPSMTKTMIPKPTPAGGEGGGEAEVAVKPGQIDRRKFILHVEAGTFTDSEIVVMLGENGTGKTTFVRMLAGALKSDEEEAALERGDEEEAELLGVPSLNVSYKPQKIRYACVCVCVRMCFCFFLKCAHMCRCVRFTETCFNSSSTYSTHPSSLPLFPPPSNFQQPQVPRHGPRASPRQDPRGVLSPSVRV